MNPLLKHTLALAAAVSLAAALSGCHTPATRDADEQFATGSDRPPTAQTLYASGQLLEARGRDDEAFWTYQRINKEDPKFVPAYCSVAEYHVRHNHLNEASSSLKAGLAVAPDDAVLVNNLGMVSMMQADYEQALAHFTRAASLMPGNARYRANMAAALGMMGRYDESAAIYEQILTYADAHHNVGTLAESRGDKERAKHEFELEAQGAPPPPPDQAKGAKPAAKPASK